MNKKIITTKESQTLISYDTIIARKERHGEILIDENYYNYSATTKKHLNDFLGVSNKFWKHAEENSLVRFTKLN